MTLNTLIIFFVFTDPSTTSIYTLSLHDALPIFDRLAARERRHEQREDERGQRSRRRRRRPRRRGRGRGRSHAMRSHRSEEHTSELQSRPHLVCRLLLEKKKKKKTQNYTENTQRQ